MSAKKIERKEYSCKRCSNAFYALPSYHRIYCSKTCSSRDNKKHGLSNEKIYNAWRNMKARCLNPKSERYPIYGGRGIKVCAEWMTFEGFKKDMLPTYREELTLDRIDVNGNYCKENCRWATIREQSENKTVSNFVTFMGKTMILPRWAEYLGIKRSTLEMRIYSYGWSIERAFTTPANTPMRKGGILSL